MLRFTNIFCIVVAVGMIGCGPLSSASPSAPVVSIVPIGINEVLPISFAEADSLYNALGTTMSACTANVVYGKLSVAVLKKTVSDKIADVAISYDGTRVLRDSISAISTSGVDVLVNPNFSVQSIAVVLGDKDYQGNALLRKLIVNGEIVADIYPFGEAKLFGDDKIISWMYVSSGAFGGRGMSIKRYIVYDAATKGIVCKFDQQ